MKWSLDVSNRIIAALKAKGAPRTCPLCGTNQWLMAGGFYYLTAQMSPPNISVGGAGMPLAAVICVNCGNTQFINLVQLGLDDLFKKAE